MNWKIVNESPEGFEPVYSVIDIETGRHIATDLEYFEANQIANSPEMYEIICNSVKAIEELYVHYNKKDYKFLNSVNEIVTEMYKILDEVHKNEKIEC